jgi:hypothetical protein
VALHILPAEDLIGHGYDDSCICGPSTEIVKRTDGSVGRLVVHHSLDGREIEEPTTGGSPDSWLIVEKRTDGD